MLTHIADRLFGRPLMVHPRKAEIIVAFLGERIGATFDGSINAAWDPVFMRALRDAPSANRLVGEPGGPRDAMGRVQQHLYNMVEGVAVIPVIGSLVNRGAFIGDDGSGFTSYEGLQVQVEGAAADPRAHTILLDIESPGGETAGAFGLFETIRKARSVKPVVALVNDMAASAAYGIAASASEIVVQPGSITGSIGVVMLHLDHSAQLAKKGIKPTFIFAGAKKVDGNSLEPLSAEVRAELQGEVDALYDQFIAAVVAGRPGLTGAAVRATEAGILLGEAAIKLGFADRVGNFSETVRRLGAATRVAVGGPNTMTDRTYSQAELDAAVANARTESAAGATVATRAAVNEAMARVRAILTHGEAQGREAAALRLALDNPEMTAEAAVALLSSLPKAEAAPKTPAVAERSAPAIPGAQTLAAPNAAAAWEGIYEKMNKSANLQSHPLA